ncbi:OmpA family protein [Marinomonas flavescens]|uniref:OmpA family protein n=1 Tax=Marinomonas flavescens TaxID=2529379 RepID=UPI00105435C6|nr:OmpA family protein [Marinomonas flavescens]
MKIAFKTLYTISLLLMLSSTSHAENLFNSNVRQGLNDQDKDGVIDIRDRCPNTPLGDAVDTNGCPTATSKMMTLDIDILFDSGKAIVKPKFYPKIKKLADFLKEHKDSHVVIEGHTDNVGSEKANQELSQKRASAIADVLIDSFRISPKRVKAIGYGESRPIDKNDTPEGRARNRRVIADIYAESKADVERWTIYSVDKNTHTAPHKQ